LSSGKDDKGFWIKTVGDKTLPYQYKIDRLKVNGNFDVYLKNPITRISEFTISPSVNLNPFSVDVFNAYKTTEL
jgi:hypothetical protein